MCLGHESSGEVVKGTLRSCFPRSRSVSLLLFHSTDRYQPHVISSPPVGESVETVVVGDKVAMEPGEVCRRCFYCQKGMYEVRWLCPGPGSGPCAFFLSCPAHYPVGTALISALFTSHPQLCPNIIFAATPPNQLGTLTRYYKL
jgi:hypothetical protein